MTDKKSLKSEIDELRIKLAEYKYTPQSYDEMWKRVKEAVNENDELKAANVALEEQLVQMHEGLTLAEQENNELKGKIEVLRAALGELVKERDELKAENEQCLTAHAMLNDKVCALEAENAELKRPPPECTYCDEDIDDG